METEVKLNPAGVKKVRESKSWTQEHLASAAGVSLRTIQRMESEGSASAESRLAVAAALGVPVESIRLAQDSSASGVRWGYAGVLVGTLASAAGILSGSSSPEQAGMALGILGAFAGIAAGAIGVLSRRATSR